MWLLINLILILIVCYIIYNTSLSFLGLYMPFKQTVLPILFFASIAFISKVILKATPIVHTLLMVSTCTIITYILSRKIFILNLCASLLTFIIMILGSLLVVFPLFNVFGFNLTIKNYYTINWIILNIGELSIPMVILILNRMNKFSLINKIISK